MINIYNIQKNNERLVRRLHNIQKEVDKLIDENKKLKSKEQELKIKEQECEELKSLLCSSKVAEHLISYCEFTFPIAQALLEDRINFAKEYLLSRENVPLDKEERTKIMNKKITECNVSELLKFTQKIDEENEKAFHILENELELTKKQYDKVVEQNRSLQSELKFANRKLNLIKEFLEKQLVLEPTAMYIKENINKILELK